jgi:hypothetical protein
MTKVFAICLPEEALTHPTQSLQSARCQIVELTLAQRLKKLR